MTLTGLCRTIVVASAALMISAASGGEIDDLVERTGLCDASAAVPLGDDRLLIASDEDNVLRIYSKDGGEPEQAFDINEPLEISGKNAEADIEGAATLGKRIYWITSHGRNKNGKERSNRFRFFAVECVDIGSGRRRLDYIGKPYQRLLDDLLADERLRSYDFAAGSEKAPKLEGALNIEGLCVAPDGQALWIGFRNPIPAGKALIVPLENPAAVLEGQRAEFGEPIELALDGLGIRALDYWEARDQYVIIAGHHDERSGFMAYLWSGKPTDPPEAIDDLEWDDLRPESIVTYPGNRERFQIVSDEGGKEVGGVECKDLPDATGRSFRTAWVTP